MNAWSADLASDRAAIDAWIQAGKFSDAAFFCREQLSSPNLKPTESVGYGVELVRVLSEQARWEDPDTADGVWDEAVHVGDDLSRKLENLSATVLVQFQTAQAATARVETEVRTQAVTSERREVILSRIRRALARWESLEEELQRRLRAGGEARGKPQAALGSNLLRSLADRTLYGRARLYLSRAALYPPNSDDRVLACRQAIEALEGISPNHVGPIWWDTRVAILKAHRLKSDRARLDAQAQRLLEGPALPTCVAQRVEAERLRLAIWQEDWPTVERYLVSAPEQRDGDRCPEWDIAHLEALVALANAQGGSEDWSAKTRAQLARVTDRYSPYWQRVADAVVVSDQNRSAPILSDLATVRLRQGNVSGAIEALDTSAERARGQGDVERAWRLRLEAARLSAQTTDWHDTMMRAARLGASDEAPDAALAAEAQLIAIKASAQALREGATQTAVYQGHLRRFVDRWSSHPEASRVRFWLANLYAAQQRYGEALTQYLQIDPSFDEMLDVVDRIGQGARRFGPEHALGQPARNRLQALSQSSSQATAEAARLWLLRLDGVLDASPIAATETTPAQVRETAEGLAWLQFAVRGDYLAARRGIAAFTSQDAELWDDLLHRLADHASARHGNDGAQTIIEAVDRAEAQSAATPAQQLDWKVVASRAKLALGDVDEAQQTLRELRASHPENVEVWEAYAHALGAGEVTDQRAAVEEWQRLVRAVPKASQPWYRAKYQLANAHARLGDVEAARKTIALTRTLYPELGGEPWASKFNDLDARLQN